MSSGEHLCQVADIDLEVASRDLDLVMAKELLDESDVDSPLEKERRARR